MSNKRSVVRLMSILQLANERCRMIVGTFIGNGKVPYELYQYRSGSNVYLPACQRTIMYITYCNCNTRLQVRTSTYNFIVVLVGTVHVLVGSSLFSKRNFENIICVTRAIIVDYQFQIRVVCCC